MFDAKSLLSMVLGAAQQGGRGGAGGGGGLGGGLGGNLGGLVNEVLTGLRNQPGQTPPSPPMSPPANLAGQGNMAAQAAPAGGLQGNVADALAQAREAVRTGNYAALTEQAKALLQGNAGGLLVGGLAGLALGTKGGRSLIGTAAKLGGVALVGGLAYTAWRNYQAGRPVEATATEVAAAPQGSGFAEGDGDDQAKALMLVRAMVAAAAADGHVDATERGRILGNLRQVGLDDEAAHFLEREFAAPMDATALAALATTPEQAAQIYTAARLAIDPDTEAERTFLTALARTLAIDPALAAHIDAAAGAVTAPAGSLPA